MKIDEFEQLDEYLWQIPKTYRDDMRVPARVYASRTLLEDAVDDKSFDQLVNTTTLPGIVGYAIAMPDVHQGYGFPVGGVAATDVEEGIISPGAIGYYINCGVRLLASDLDYEEAEPHLDKLATILYENCPSGVGQGGRFRLSHLRAGSMPGLAEEAPLAYKEVDEVVHVVEEADIARAVARLEPVAVIKG